MTSSDTMQDIALKILIGLFAVFAILFLAVPFLYQPGTFLDLDGSPSIIDRDWSSYGAGGIVYLIGDLLCHQEHARSFILNGNQMPICIRDTGLIIGLDVGLVCGLLHNRWMGRKKVLLTGFLLLLPTLFEWIAEHAFDLDLPGIRFVAALVSGFGAALIVCFLIYRNAANQL